MVFSSPSWVSEVPIPCDVPDSIPVGDFVLGGDPTLLPEHAGKAPLVCALSGKSHSLSALRERTELLARSLCDEFGWSPNVGEPWDKVVTIYSLNTIDYLVLCWAIHRAGGICLLIHPTSSVAEVESHMKLAGSRIIFTCESLLPATAQVVEHLGIPHDKVFLLDLPGPPKDKTSVTNGFKTLKSVADLVTRGSSLDQIDELRWERGQGAKQVAYLTSTSGTSGLQKLAKITHTNVIANSMQAVAFEKYANKGSTQVSLGILPLSHSYGLVLAHAMVYRGDSLILHTHFDMQATLASVAKYKIERLYLVPSITAALVKNSFLFKMYDVSSVRSIVSGAGPFPRELGEALRKLQPDWQILPGYGLTESSVIASYTSPHDIWLGSSGSLLPLFKARLVSEEGHDIEDYDEPGELLLSSPSIMQGFLGDAAANEATFDADGWLRTGDVAVVRLNPDQQTEHLFIVDRLKDMIKVKGLQVAPAEIEAQLRNIPAVSDNAVIGVPDRAAGERAKAFIVRSPAVMADVKEAELGKMIEQHIQSNLPETHWLRGGITFVDEIPRNAAGKTLKKILRTLE